MKEKMRTKRKSLWAVPWIFLMEMQLQDWKNSRIREDDMSACRDSSLSQCWLPMYSTLASKPSNNHRKNALDSCHKGLQFRATPTPAKIGACAMTTKFLDKKICTFKIVLSWCFPRKIAFWTIFLSAPKAPPSKSENLIFIIVSPSLSFQKHNQQKKTQFLRSGRGAAGRCTGSNGPKWSRRQCWSNLPHSKPDLAQNGPKLFILVHFPPEEVHVGPFWSTNRTLANPEFLKLHLRSSTSQSLLSFFFVLSPSASGGSFYRGASSKADKAHFAAWTKGPENR